jgi:hypothetical protein
VSDYQFIDDLFTDVFTDGLHPSAFPSLVMPHSVAILVGNTKKPFTDGFTDGIYESKKVSRLKYTDRFYSVSDIVIYRQLRTVVKFVGECLKYRPNISVGNCASYCQMPTYSFRR